ncbi:hypothetical protein HanIR_Chr09g0402641 [Helianthus annuus]|nr:hypothetical protein HanIR_Chr09g0402641 [Helianthus annuus]
MPDPSTASSQEKTHPVPSGHGGVPKCLQKRQSSRSFYFPTRGRAQLNTVVVNAKIRRICHTPKIHTRSITAWRRDMTRIKPPIILNM